MQYRLISSDDIPAVARLRLCYLEEAYHGLLPGQYETLLQQNISFLREHLGRDCLVAAAFSETEAVGSVYLSIFEKPANRRFPNGRFGEIYGVYTIPKLRRRGVATALLRMILEKAPALSLSFLELEASADGFSLYQKLGFIETPSDYRKMKYPLAKELLL